VLCNTKWVQLWQYPFAVLSDCSRVFSDGRYTDNVFQTCCPPEQHWYIATSSEVKPIFYVIASTSFRLIHLAIFILYFLCSTSAVDQGCSPFYRVLFWYRLSNLRAVNRRVLFVVRDWKHYIMSIWRQESLENIKMQHQPFKDEAYLFYIRTQCVPRCKHSPLRL
jgi:hypothetical protein